MNTILFNFNVHIQALNIHPLASLAPLRDFFLADILRDIYFSPSRQGCKEIFRFILAPFAPLRDHNTFMREDNYFLRDIFLAKPPRAQRRFIVYVLRLSYENSASFICFNANLIALSELKSLSLRLLHCMRSLLIIFC